MTQSLSIETKNAIDLAVSTAADHFGEMLKSLAHDLAKERSRSKQLAKQIVDYKSILSAKSTPPQTKTEPKLPQGFKFSPDTIIKRAELTAELSALRVQEQRELSAYESQTIAAIAQRNQKAHKEASYAQALRSNFHTAVGAIAARKAEIERDGQTIILDINGNTAKGELDFQNMTLFTFEKLSLPDFEFKGKTYKVTSANISDIGAGNVYHFVKA